jgi:hypothetical protein
LNPTETDLVLSVVVVSPETYATVRKVIGYLAAQSLSARMEIVIVAPSAAQLNPDLSEMSAFGAFQVVELGPLHSVGAARTAGARRARAPIVAFSEEHCYPAPGWAEALVAAHRQPGVAAVGPAFHSANPATSLAWADFLVLYGPFLAPVPAGDYPDLPGHNSSYKRDALALYGDDLEAWLESETVLHHDLLSRGCRLYLEPQARVFHLNMSRPSSAFRENVINGRFFASARARRWPLWRRLAYALAWPLVPLVRFPRVLQHYRRIRVTRRLRWNVMPLAALLLVVSAWGEMLGNLFGAGNIRQALVHLELVREAHLAPGDQVVEPA